MKQLLPLRVLALIGTIYAGAAASSIAAAATHIAYTPSQVLFSTNNQSITPMIPAVVAPTGATVTGFALSSSSSAPLPAGLSLDTKTGRIAGLPISASPAEPFKITATFSDGTHTSTTINIAVDDNLTVTNGAVTSQAQLYYPARWLTYTAGQTTHTTTPVLAPGSGAPSLYSVSPSLPTGLTFDSSTGTISGTPSAASATPTNYTVTAAFPGGSTTTTVINIAVSGTPLAVSYLYLFPRDAINDSDSSCSSNTAEQCYGEFLTKGTMFGQSLAKFDEMVVYDLPSQPAKFGTYESSLNNLQITKPFVYVAQTLGPDGWEETAWSCPGIDFYVLSSSCPSAVISGLNQVDGYGVDVETLHQAAFTGNPAMTVSQYVQNVAGAARSNSKALDVWYTGDWVTFKATGNMAPTVFSNTSPGGATPSPLSQISAVHWMDLPKYYCGDESNSSGGAQCDVSIAAANADRLRALTTCLIDQAGFDRSVVQLGFLDDTDLQTNANRAIAMLQILEEMGVHNFNLYIHFADILFSTGSQPPTPFQQFYDSVAKAAN
jgi:putative Ig domain-containing protein